MKHKTFKLLSVCISMILLAGCNTNTPSDNGHNALQHEFKTEVITKNATCLENGTKQLKCDCGSYIEETIYATGHKYVWETKTEESCLASEVLNGVCSVCGATTTSLGKPAVGHHYTWETITEATCTTKEVLKGKCTCGDEVVEEGEVLGHSYGELHIVNSSSQYNEGLVRQACSNGCGNERLLKVMKTPVVSRKIDVISWSKIDGATGYRVYNGDELLADVNDNLSYRLPLAKISNYSLSVEAYTDDETYYDLSNKSETLSLRCTTSSNLQDGLGTDFEYFRVPEGDVIEIGDWNKNYYDSTKGKTEIIKGDGNNYAKLTPTNESLLAKFTHASNTAILKAGTYVLSLDVKLGSAADGTLKLIGLWPNAWIASTRNLPIDISNANTDTWTTVSCEYTIDQSVSNGFVNVDIGYTGKVVNENNYILVDNFKICRKGSDDNLNKNKNSDFESFFTQNLDSSGWRNNGVNDVVLIPVECLDNSFETIDDNVAFKAYTENEKCTSFSFKGSVEMATQGLYKLSFRVKGGKDATDLGSIGFRLFGENNFKVVDVRFDGVENINDTEWTTLEAVFYVSATKTTTYVNVECYVYTNNDRVQSKDNYVLLDDLSVYRINIEE